jgi:hypothetical protein
VSISLLRRFLEDRMPKKVGKRTVRRRKTIRAESTPYKVQLLATLLQNIYWNGFEERRGTSYRINRSRLTDLAEVQRFEVGTLKKLVERLKADGFIFYPLDKGNFTASEWFFEKLDKLRELPQADDKAIRKAEDRSDVIP